MEKIVGLIDAPFTPFDAEGKVNIAPIAAYCDMLVRSGIKGVFVNGSSGEGYMLDEDERKLLAAEWVRVAPKDFKVIVHVGSTCLASAARLAAHAAEIGAWGIGAMATPFPKMGSIEQLISYIEPMAAAAPGLPFYYYHIPVFNGAYLSMLDLLKAVDGRIPNFAGIKYTYENLYEYNRCMRYADGKFDMLHGQDETILSALVMGGAKGGICGTSNYNAVCLNGIVDAWKAGDIDKARELQNYAQDVIDVIAKYRGNIVAGKRIMKLIGLDLGPNRAPFVSVTPEEEAKIKAELEAIDFFNRCNPVK